MRSMVEGLLRQTTKKTVARARGLRRTMSPPEAKLWLILRQRPAGLKFRRQHPVGPYVADFYCPERKLVIEIDGIAHEMGDRPRRDEQRDAWLRDQDYRVVRISADEVRRNVQGVLDYILPF